MARNVSKDADGQCVLAEALAEATGRSPAEILSGLAPQLAAIDFQMNEALDDAQRQLATRRSTRYSDSFSIVATRLEQDCKI
jgi:hypothetical protein